MHGVWCSNNAKKKTHQQRAKVPKSQGGPQERPVWVYGSRGDQLGRGVAEDGGETGGDGGAEEGGEGGEGGDEGGHLEHSRTPFSIKDI